MGRSLIDLNVLYRAGRIKVKGADNRPSRIAGNEQINIIVDGGRGRALQINQSQVGFHQEGAIGKNGIGRRPGWTWLYQPTLRFRQE